MTRIQTDTSGAGGDQSRCATAVDAKATVIEKASANTARSRADRVQLRFIAALASQLPNYPITQLPNPH
jgi:hypothetical protein